MCCSAPSVTVLVILPRLGRAKERADALVALRRFSRAGHLAVALSVLTGVASTAPVLGRWPVDLDSPYEDLLDTKAMAVMTGLAIVNRYIFVPRLPPTLPALCPATLVEVLLGLLDPG